MSFLYRSSLLAAIMMLASTISSAQSLVDGRRLRALSKEGTILTIEPVVVSPGTPCQTSTKKFINTKEGLMVEVVRPKDGCNFKSLTVEVNGTSYPLVAIAGFTMTDGKYSWGEGVATGDLLFSTPLDLSLASVPKLKIIGFTPTNATESATEDSSETWQDATTGLVWLVKPVGRTSWWAGAFLVRNLDQGGYADWRLPTFAELAPLFKPKGPLKNPSGDYIWAGDHVGSAIGKSVYQAYYNYSLSPEEKVYVFAVRGGDASLLASFRGKVQGKIDADRAQADKERRDRLEAERQALAYERRVADFRKSVQEGDDTSQGVVIQIKGNLVKVQTNDNQCSQRDYKGNCVNYISTPVEKWFKRSEIYPK